MSQLGFLVVLTSARSFMRFSHMILAHSRTGATTYIAMVDESEVVVQHQSLYISRLLGPQLSPQALVLRFPWIFKSSFVRHLTTHP